MEIWGQPLTKSHPLIAHNTGLEQQIDKRFFHASIARITKGKIRFILALIPCELPNRAQKTGHTKGHFNLIRNPFDPHERKSNDSHDRDHAPI